ncbi:MAG: hypothetical protein CMJ83_00770 [Planctomycetes bacterium]|nr:hypothetical protein [Planctomycetota bacterium]
MRRDRRTGATFRVTSPSPTALSHLRDLAKATPDPHGWTDDLGRFAIAHVPDRPVRLAVRHPHHPATDTEPFVPTPLARARPAIRLGASATLRGSVGSSPRPGLRVVLVESDLAAESVRVKPNPDGSYVVRGVPRCRLSVATHRRGCVIHFSQSFDVPADGEVRVP